MMDNKRVYVICHMLQSIDSKIAGNIFQSPITQSLAGIYGQMSQEFDADAIVYGSVTVNEMFITHQRLSLKEYSILKIDKEDYVDNDVKEKFIIVIDPLGSLAWNSQNLCIEKFMNKSIIMVLSENVSCEYLAYLRSLKISYIFAGKDELSMKIVLEKVNNLFGIHKVILQGGGIVNESFENEGLIDELSLIISPVIGGESDVPTSFETGTLIKPYTGLSNYHLEKVQILQRSGLWLHYINEH